MTKITVKIKIIIIITLNKIDVIVDKKIKKYRLHMARIAQKRHKEEYSTSKNTKTNFVYAT